MSNTAFKYQETYNNLGDLNNPQLLQTFIYSNVADIERAISYWDKKKSATGASSEMKEHARDQISRLENILIQRLEVTEDLFSQFQPVKPVEVGPEQNKKEPAKVKKQKDNKKKGKVIDIKTKKEVEDKEEKVETVNEKLGKEINNQKDELPNAYDEKYPTDEEKIEALNNFLDKTIEPIFAKPVETEEDIENRRDKARRRLNLHLKLNGTYKGSSSNRFCDDAAVEGFLDWVESGHFHHRNPLDVIRGTKLSITEIITETEQLVQAGQGEQEVKDYLEPYILGKQLKEQDEGQIIENKEGFEQFFRSILGFIFDKESQRKQQETPRKENGEKAQEDSKVDEELLNSIYEELKDSGDRALAKIAGRYVASLKKKGFNGSPTAEFNNVKDYFATKDPDLVKAWEENQKEKEEKRKEEENAVKVEKTVETDTKSSAKTEEDTEKTKSEDNTSSENNQSEEPKEATLPFTWPTGETRMKTYKDLNDFKGDFLTVFNKGVSHTAKHEPTYDDKLDYVNAMALRYFIGEDAIMKETADWTEADVYQWMATEVIPYTEGEYKLLSTENKDDLKEILKSEILTKYPAGEEEAREKALKTIYASDIPRTDYARSMARKVRKGNFKDFNNFISEINKEMEKKKD
jgi:hypothetical protein